MVAIVFAFLACESTVTNFKFKEKDPKLVVIGFAEPDAPPTMHVSKSISLTESIGYYPIENAVFKVYENSTNNLLGVLEIDANDYYTNSTITFQEGEFYRVEVEADGFERATANFELPDKTIILDVTNDLRQENNDFDSYYTNYFDINVQVETSNKELEYFEVELYQHVFLYEIDEFGNITDSIEEIRSVNFYSQSTGVFAIREYGDYYLLPSQEYEVGGEAFYLSNEFISGDVISFNLKVPVDNYYYYDGQYSDNATYKYTLFFNKVDKNIFKYAASRARQGETEYNPFVEQVSIFTNVESGLGIVGGRTKNSVQLDLTDLAMDIVVYQ